MADQMSDGIFSAKIAYQGSIGPDLRFLEWELAAVADILDANRDVVQPDAMTGHPCLRHQSINGSIPVHQKMCRDVDFAGSCKLFTRAFRAITIKVIPR